MKEKRYYLDTSIWLDLFEERGLNGEIAKKLFKKMIMEDSIITFSEVVKNELIKYGFHPDELKYLISPFNKNLIYVYTNKEQFGKTKDLAVLKEIYLD